MANWVHNTAVPLLYLASQDPPVKDQGNWTKNPNISSVVGVPQKYWKLSGIDIVEMTAAEKASVDSLLAAAQKTGNKTRVVSDQVITAIVSVIIDELNAIRANFSPAMSARTANQITTAIRAKIDALP